MDTITADRPVRIMRVIRGRQQTYTRKECRIVTRKIIVRQIARRGDDKRLGKLQDKGIQLDYITSQTTDGLFRLHRGCYTPDFYDPENETYYEVSGSRQAFGANKHKYREMREKYPGINLKIVIPDGTEITLNGS